MQTDAKPDQPRPVVRGDAFRFVPTDDRRMTIAIYDRGELQGHVSLPPEVAKQLGATLVVYL